MLKQQLINYILKKLDEKIQAASKASQSIRESRDNETKSSAGDKFETGRAMMQAELDKSEMYHSKLVQQKLEVEQLDVAKKMQRIEIGSLVLTDRGNFFISIPVGKIPLGDVIYYAISVQSPVGSKLLGHSKGDKIEFNGTIQILDVS